MCVFVLKDPLQFIITFYMFHLEYVLTFLSDLGQLLEALDVKLFPIVEPTAAFTSKPFTFGKKCVILYQIIHAPHINKYRYC